MNRTRNLKTLLWVVFALQIMLAPIDHFLVKDRNLFPYYSWELGFGKAYAKAPQNLVYIHSIDGQELPPKSTIKSQAHRFDWRKRQDSKFVSSLIRDLKANNTNRFESNQKVFETKFFEKQGFKEVHYSLVFKITDLQNGDSKETTFGPFEFRVK